MVSPTEISRALGPDSDGDPRALSAVAALRDTAAVHGALEKIGTHEATRAAAVRALRRCEARAGRLGGDVRETVTGPVCDALHAHGPELTKTLADGSVFAFRYRTKIARDFVLAPEDAPDHVWEPQTTRLTGLLAARSRTMIVGGGYIGDHAVMAARALGARGGVCIAFEPNGESAALMRKNASANGVGALSVVEAGLWRAGVDRLVLEGDDSHAAPAVAGADAAGGFPATTVDRHVAGTAIGDLDILMLDIEGGEDAALEGAEAQLSKPAGRAPAVLFEIHASYVDWSEGLAKTPPVARLLAHGYHVFALRDFQSNVPMAGCAIELIPHAEVWLEGPPHGFNMLALKDASSLAAPPFRIVREHVSPKLLLHKDPILHHPTEWRAALPAWIAGTDAD